MNLIDFYLRGGKRERKNIMIKSYRNPFMLLKKKYFFFTNF